MHHLTRATFTLIGGAAAAFLIWLATQVVGNRLDTNGDYWAAILLLAAAGLVIALSQLLGGWTKWGWPRLSMNVFLFAFVPALVIFGWILVFSQPDTNSARRHATSWANDIGIDNLFRDMSRTWQALALILGLFAGLTLDTTGPRVRRALAPAGEEPPPAAAVADRPPGAPPPAERV